MSDIARAMIIVAILLGGAWVARGMYGTDRYDLVPAAGGAVYRIDRLAGAVSLCIPAACRPVPELTFRPQPAKPDVPPADRGQNTQPDRKAT